MEVHVDIGTTPLMVGQADQVVDVWLDEVVHSYGRQGLSEVHRHMDLHFKNPTPYYETQVTVDVAQHQRVIHDRGVIYGPWLAGVGSRNATSRFKGYPHWRRTKQWLGQTEGPRILARHMPELGRRLTG